MATTKEYKDFILERLSLLDNIRCRPMMGEYLLYYNDTLFGGIYDERLLVKITESNKGYKMRQEIPYTNAKPMHFIDEIDNKEKIRDIIIDTCKDLASRKLEKK